jgi:hypothetical protein
VGGESNCHQGYSQSLVYGKTTTEAGPFASSGGWTGDIPSWLGLLVMLKVQSYPIWLRGHYTGYIYLGDILRQEMPPVGFGFWFMLEMQSALYLLSLSGDIYLDRR